MGDVTFVSGNHTTINGGIFVEAGRDAHVQSGHGPYRQGLELLFKHIAPGAFHNAAERVDPPKCHPKTRIAILDEIMTWVKSPPGHKKFIMWLYGPAGAGKSAIAQTIAEMCAKDGILAASFFFFRTSPGRNTSLHLIPTLAYQLSISIPGLKDYLTLAVEDDPAIFKRTLSAQMQALVIDPITKAHADGKLQTLHSSLVIIDGLDECISELEQQEILASAADQLLQSRLIFFVISRPEFTIRTALNKSTVAELVQRMALDDNYQPDEDIKLFLNDTFKNLRITHPAGTDIPLNWPPEEHLTYLVTKSSGQFIYASTVAKYVSSPRHHPSKRLKIILGLSITGNDTPFSQLDALYRHILSTVEDLPKVLDVLTFILLDTGPPGGYPIYFGHEFETMNKLERIEHMFDYDSGEVRTVLMDMHALVLVPQKDDTSSKLRIYHASLQDFLFDRSRSKEYFIDTEKGYTMITLNLLKILVHDPNTQDVALHNFVVNNTDILTHCFVYHCQEAPLSMLLHSTMTQPIHPLSYSNFHYTPWLLLFQCLDSLGFDQYVHHAKDQLITLILDQLYKYPESLCLSILTSLHCFLFNSRYTRSCVTDIFDMLLHGTTSSSSDFNHLKALDQSFFSFQGFAAFTGGGIHFIVTEILPHRNIAGRYFVNEDTYRELAQHLVNFLSQRESLLKLEEINDNYTGMRYPDDRDEDPTTIIRLELPDLDYLSRIFERSSKDAEFSALLESKLSFWEEGETFLTPKARQNMLKFSEEYIERCRDINDNTDGSSTEGNPDGDSLNLSVDVTELTAQLL